MIRRALGYIAIVGVAACSAGGTAVAPRLSSAGVPVGSPAFARSPVKHQFTRVTLRIKIPHPPKRARTAGPAYISPATESLVYVVSDNGSPVSGGSGYANLTPSSSGCTQSGALQSLTCTVTLPLLVQHTGTYSFALATYDATQSGPTTTAPCTPPSSSGCNGNLLSQSTATQTLTVGLINNVGLTLGGIPTSVTVQPVSPGYLQGSAIGLQLWGKDAQQLGIEARDADGNAIVGPGAPTISVTSTNTGKLTVTSPSSSTPNIATLQATTSGTPAVVTPGAYDLTVHVTPAAASGGSALALTVPVTVAHSILYVADRDSEIHVYYDGNTGSANYAISANIFDPLELAVDANGTLYVANSGTGVIYAYPQGATSPSETIALPNTPNTSYASGVAVDATGALYATDYANDAIYRYPAGSSTGTTFLGPILKPISLALDATGKLYEASATVVGAGVFYGGTNIANIGSSTVVSIAVDASGSLYESTENAGTGNVQVFSIASSTLDATVTNGLEQPTGIAVDAAGTLYVLDGGDNKLLEYAAPITSASTPIRSISTGQVLLAQAGVAVVPSAIAPSQILPALAHAHPRLHR